MRVMAREWKPGDVAVTKGGSFRALRTPDRWVFDDESTTSTVGEHLAGFRPLVVIDAEDREQVERLTSLLDWALHPHDADRLRAALREFAAPTPPKPEEPTGLGAVVEDAEGVRWVRYARPGSTAPWVDGMTSVEWDDVAAVRVLSEGVQ